MRFAIPVSVMRMCFSTPTLTGLPRGLFPSPVPQALQSGSPACADVAEGFIPKALSCFDFSAKSSHLLRSFPRSNQPHFHTVFGAFPPHFPATVLI